MFPWVVVAVGKTTKDHPPIPLIKLIHNDPTFHTITTINFYHMNPLTFPWPFLGNNVHGPVLDSMRCGYFLQSLPISNGLQNVYYGGDHHYENVGNMSDEEMRNLPCEHLMSGDGGYYATTVKQQGRAEGCDATEEDGDGRIGTSEVNTTERQSSWINEFWF